jgi:hypothetical protein
MTLLSILLVGKTGVVHAINMKEFVEDDLYKRAGFKYATGFEKRAVYSVDNHKQIHVYGKITGRAGQENKYEFPPPIAEVLFFGTVVLVAKVNEVPTDLTLAEWETAYDALMGGFEDLGTEDSTEETTSSEEEQRPLTRDGYVKDNFVVDDDEDEEEEVPQPPPKRTKKAAKKMEQVFVSAARALIESPSPENVMLDCSNELTEEEYDDEA